jgi:hypothetical protein
VPFFGDFFEHLFSGVRGGGVSRERFGSRERIECHRSPGAAANLQGGRRVVVPGVLLDRVYGQKTEVKKKVFMVSVNILAR